jgi:HlyD family secretion protein
MRDVTITAPMNGTVIEKTIEPGFIIASASGTFGGGTTLMKMADLSVVRVRALVDQTDIGKVQPGQQARVTVEAYPGRPFNGEVVKIEPQAVVDQNVTMFPVLVDLPNDERLLKPGMNTEVEIEIAERTGALVVPNDAVVGMRDATTAGKALGLSEDEIGEKMQTLRSSARGTPTAAPGTQVAQASGTDNTKASTNAQPAPECAKLTAKLRASGRESLSAEERTQLRSCFGNRRQGGGALAGGPTRGTNRPGIVFVPGTNGPEPRMVMLGVNDWDYTEVVSGLQEGDQVFLMTAARLAQQERERADRMRQRSGAMGGLRQQNSNNSTQQGGRR